MTYPACSFRTASATAVVLACALALNACGGGGGGVGPAASGGTLDAATVGTASLAAAAKYGQKLTLTVNGTGLDRVTSSGTGCKDFSVSTTAPYVSTATTAYFQCTVTALGAAQVVLKRASDGVTLSTVSFDVPAPQVTFTFNNTAGINNNVVLTLAPEQTPITVDNFLRYVNSGFYNGTRIHRVAPGFVIQGGGYEGVISGNATTANIPGLKPNNGPIALEVNKGLSNAQWTIGMARETLPNTASSQFYFNLSDNRRSLDPSPGNDGYAVFGSVTTGTAAIAAIADPLIAPCVAIITFSSAGECTPIPNVVLTTAVQTR